MASLGGDYAGYLSDSSWCTDDGPATGFPSSGSEQSFARLVDQSNELDVAADFLDRVWFTDAHPADILAGLTTEQKK